MGRPTSHKRLPKPGQISGKPPEALGVFTNPALHYRPFSRSFSIADDTPSGLSRGRKCPAPGYTSRATREVNDARSTAESGGLSATPSFAPYRTIEGT